MINQLTLTINSEETKINILYNVEECKFIGVFTVLADSKYRSTEKQIVSKIQIDELRSMTDLIRTREFRNMIKNEGSNSLTSTNLIDIILIHLSDIPPLTLLPNAETYDRQKHWYGRKLDNELLFYSFKSYFRGDENPYTHLSPNIKKLIDLRRDDYLALYGVLHDGWSYIVNEFKKSRKNLLKSFPTPGKTFLEIIALEGIYSYFLCYPEDPSNGGNTFEAFSPRQSIKRSDKFEKLKSKEKLNKLSKQDSKNLETLTKECKKIYLKDWGRHLRDVCVNACAKAPKDSTVHRKLIEYRRINDELWAVIRSLSRKSKGHAWNDGDLLTGNKEGGTYS